MRDSRIDTLKGIMIIFIVLGHYFEHKLDDETVRVLYSMIYLIHIPVFVYLSGLTFKLSKQKSNTGFFLFCIVLGQLLYSAVCIVLYGTPFIDYWILWYLYAMIAWSLCTRYINVNLKTVFIAIIVALVWGVFPHNEFWRFSRIIGFYPYFLLGYLQIHKKIELSRASWQLLSAGAVVGAVMLIQKATVSTDNVEMLYNSKSYSVLGQSISAGMYSKALWYAVAFIFILVLMRISFTNKTLAKWGKYSIAIYLVHGVLAKVISKGLNVSDPIILAVLAVMTVAILGCAPVTDWLRKSYLYIVDNWRLMRSQIIGGGIK